jgi:hypothetical protein
MKVQVYLTFILYAFVLNLFDQSYPVEGNFVIFENVGMMASSVSYLHGQLTLNLSSIEDHFESYIRMLQRYNDSIVPLISNVTVGNFGWEPHLRWLHEENTQITYNIVKLHLQEIEDIRQQILTLRHVLPYPSDGEQAYQRRRHGRDLQMNLTVNTDIPKVKDEIKTSASTITRNTRFLPALSLPFGIFGTFMGLYNKKQIDYLRRELQTTQAGHNKLVEVVQLQEVHIQELETALFQLTKILRLQTMQNPGLLEARLNRVENQLQRRIQVATHVLQAAQLRRLSIDFLSQNQLQQLFTHLHNVAAKHGCQLLLEHHSDLFQVELSYFFDGKDVHLLLHVPMVAPDSMLRLLKLHPFPLPLTSDSHYLLPSSENDILAITAGSERLSIQISSSDLIGCHTINNVYKCESHGVLRKTFTDTCLGSMYQQNITAVKKLCTLKVHNAEEIVRQLLNNWFAVFSPKQITIPVECRNGTSRELMIPKGITKFHLSEGCTAQFANHMVTSDYSIREPADFIEYEWKWDPIQLQTDGLNPSTLLPHMELLAKHGIHYPTLEDLQELKLQETHGPGWWAHFVHFVGNATLVIALIIGLTVLGFRFKRHLLQKRQHTEEQLQEQENLQMLQAPVEHLPPIIRAPRPQPVVMPMH